MDTNQQVSASHSRGTTISGIEPDFWALLMIANGILVYEKEHTPISSPPMSEDDSESTESI